MKVRPDSKAAERKKEQEQMGQRLVTGAGKRKEPRSESSVQFPSRGVYRVEFPDVSTSPFFGKFHTRTS